MIIFQLFIEVSSLFDSNFFIKRALIANSYGESRIFLMIIVVIFIYQLLASTSNGSPAGSRRSGRSSVFSLFNLKERSKFWSEAVIRGGTHISSFSNFPPSPFYCWGIGIVHHLASKNKISMCRFWWFGVFQPRKDGSFQLHQGRYLICFSLNLSTKHVALSWLVHIKLSLLLNFQDNRTV